MNDKVCLNRIKNEENRTMTVPKKTLAIQTAASAGQHRVQTAGFSANTRLRLCTYVVTFCRSRVSPFAAAG